MSAVAGRLRDADGRGQTEQDTRDEREPDAEGQNAGVEMGFVQTRDACGSERDQGADSPGHERQAENSGSSGKKHALRQQLPRDAQPARAQSGSERDLAA